MKAEDLDSSDNLQLVKFPTVGLFNYWADMSNDDGGLHSLKNDDDFDDDVDVTDWKEPEKNPQSSPEEEEGVCIYVIYSDS